MRADFIRRIWTLSDTPADPIVPHLSITANSHEAGQPDGGRKIWDSGNEFWEIYDDNESLLRRYRVIERKVIGECLEEILECLPETPVPLGVVLRSIGTKWKITTNPYEGSRDLQGTRVQESYPPSAQGLNQQARSEKLQPQHTPPQQQHSQHPPQLTPPQHPQKRIPLQRQSRQQLCQGQVPQMQQNQNQNQMPVFQTTELLEQTSLNNMKKRTTSSSDSDKDSIITANSEIRQITPMQLWSSLSQWIPASALFQPSLHHQAMLDLSDKPIHIRPVTAAPTLAPRRQQKQKQRC